jgi:superfamily II DNA helicase RecQ
MQVKLFNTRMDAESIVADQQALNAFLDTVIVKQTATQFVNGAPDYWSILVFYEFGDTIKPKKEKPIVANTPVHNSPEVNHTVVNEEPVKITESTETELTDDEKQIALALKTWRKDKSNEMQQPEFMIFPNATLTALAKMKPRSMSELGKIKGIGHAKIERYGDDLMAILNAF